METNQYDAVVIGSGIGGLAAATILTKVAKKKVLVVEQHFELGGQTHEFKRKGKFSWDVGLHYIGKMDKESMPMKIFDFITNGTLKWNDLPYDFENFIYPDFQFKVPSNEGEFAQRLVDQFPMEAKAIRQYFLDIKKAVGWATLNMIIDLVPKFVAFFLKIFNSKNQNLALSITKDYLDSKFKDPKLKALLVSQWGDYGLPPGRSAFLQHSIIANHYLKGGMYPEGGAGSIAKGAQPIIEANGGKCMLNAEVNRVLVEDNKVIGVQIQHKRGDKNVEIVYAPIVISTTGAIHTYSRLLADFVPNAIQEDIAKIKKGKSAVTLFIGLNQDPKNMGFKGENNWIYESYDHDLASTSTENLMQGKPLACYLSFPSLKNHSAKGHTAEIISFAEFDYFRKWEDTKWKKRGEDYDALKEIISEGLLNLVEKNYPGFKSMVEYKELSTPLTYIELAGRSNGEFYGIPGTPERYKLKWLGVKTPVKNFYIAGSDVFSLGITGAMMGGVAAAAHAIGSGGFPKILKEANRKK
jgi:all-trans-retinol 13,14-reductase